jgi:hypothetical protein
MMTSIKPIHLDRLVAGMSIARGMYSLNMAFRIQPLTVSYLAILSRGEESGVVQASACNALNQMLHSVQHGVATIHLPRHSESRRRI